MREYTLPNGPRRFADAGREFKEPAWSAPFDEAEALRTIPEHATISGMFPAAIADAAKERGVSLASARDRYLPFRFYPLREHARLLLETCEQFYWDLPKRQALRKLGRGAPKALVSSTLGKVLLGSAHGVHDIVSAMAKAYPLNARPSGVEVLEPSEGRVIVRLTDIHYFWTHITWARSKACSNSPASRAPFSSSYAGPPPRIFCSLGNLRQVRQGGDPGQEEIAAAAHGDEIRHADETPPHGLFLDA